MVQTCDLCLLESLFRGKADGKVDGCLSCRIYFNSPWNLNYINYINFYVPFLSKAKSNTKLYFNYVLFELLIIFPSICIYAILCLHKGASLLV